MVLMRHNFDQTRPDQTVTHGLKSVKEFLKKRDRYHILRGIKHFLDALYRPFNPWYHDRVHYNFSPTHKSDRIPYIIRRHADNVGLFSYFNTILRGIAYADKHNMIPVVDMKNYPNAYLYDSEVGHVNSWEYYFEQPGGMSLEDALSSRKYILGRDTRLHSYGTDNNINYKRALVRKYIRPTRTVLERVEKLMQQAHGRKVLGVLVRGTDLIALKPHGHHIQPTAEQAILKAQEVMTAEGYDTVYLATEDKAIASKFQEAFGENLMLPEAQYIDYDYNNPMYLAHCYSDRKNDKYLRGLEYLVSILFLSKCRGFIASGSNGTDGVLVFSEGFDYLYVFDLGLYQ